MSSIDMFNSSVNNSFNMLNGSKYFAGIMMLLLNIGSRYISAELTELHQKILNHRLIRRLLIFTVVFIATRDVRVSLILTATFVILVGGLLNEDSKFCIIPNAKGMKRVTQSEYWLAKQVIQKYEKQQLMKKSREKSVINKN